MARQKKLDTGTKRSERVGAIGNLGERFKNFKQARQVLYKVSSVPTIFPQFDHATGVGGMPIERFSVVHGPSNHGKTVLANGLLLSFLQRNHFALLIDAEHTTPITWLEGLMGEHADNPRFFAMRPSNYEETVDSVREFCRAIGDAKKAGDEPEDTSALIVVDSMRKLVPANLLEKIIKEGADKAGVDGMKGRGAQIRAAMNSAWLDELIPLLATTRTAMLAITRESENITSDQWAPDFKVTGGKALIYDSSLVMRCERAAYLYKSVAKDASGKMNPAIGEKIRITITKTKVAQKEDRSTVCHFNLSNGNEYPAGFDTHRDYFELAKDFEVIETSGAWYSFEGENIGQGAHNSIMALRSNEALYQRVQEQVRARFASHAPIELDKNGVVIQ